jgi:L-fucose isomerase-like protein
LTSELDIYRIANILVREYFPEQTPLMAAKRADAMLEYGDAEGQQVESWRAEEAVRAVAESVAFAGHAPERLLEATAVREALR